MKIILAVDKNWGIGKDGDMLFHIKKDLAHFKSYTLENICIMGRKTYESMGGALPHRENIVLTRNKNYKAKDTKIFTDYRDVLAYVRESREEVFVIGGEKIVEIFLEYCDEAIITKIYEKKEADTFLHNFDLDKDWFISEESDIMEENGVSFRYVTYRRKNYGKD
ncbi:MAG: dihydrofolate reductase [Anaerococcus sp.]|uniref:dihydrofolate reductase n=1 Tax=Anaerococcus sp. TaxID=1872515 RepID=UPI00262DC4CF|nr:dihydrofolate reductase [Anaerococcus sp.]MCI5972798.1 dihydrofolate reductase [Anaerococcus sp.]MDY2928556.1 dihydrofolate reductase [Anaerococcus sp.]